MKYNYIYFKIKYIDLWRIGKFKRSISRDEFRNKHWFNIHIVSCDKESKYKLQRQYVFQKTYTCNCKLYTTLEEVINDKFIELL